jgi:hypothetical protein
VSGHRFVHGDLLLDGFLRLQRGAGEMACFACGATRDAVRHAVRAGMRGLPLGFRHGLACLRFFYLLSLGAAGFFGSRGGLVRIVGGFLGKLQYVSVGFI